MLYHYADLTVLLPFQEEKHEALICKIFPNLDLNPWAEASPKAPCRTPLAGRCDFAVFPPSPGRGEGTSRSRARIERGARQSWQRKRTQGSDSCSSGLDSSSCPISASSSISSSETGSFVRAHFILSFSPFFQFSWHIMSYFHFSDLRVPIKELVYPALLFPSLLQKWQYSYSTSLLESLSLSQFMNQSYDPSQASQWSRSIGFL